MSTQVLAGANGSFILKKVNDKTGKIDDAVEFAAVSALNHTKVGQIIGQTLKTAGSRRDAMGSLMGIVFTSPRLDGFMGKGDRDTGKVSKEFKAAVRDAESWAISMLVEEGAIKLPKGEKEVVMQQFLSELREDKNYSNYKVTANRYFAMVGANVVTEAGYLIPAEVQKAQIDAVVKKQEKDDSVSALLAAIEEKMGKETIDATDTIDSLAACKRILSTLQGLATEYAKMATMVATNAAAVAASKPAGIVAPVVAAAPATNVAATGVVGAVDKLLAHQSAKAKANDDALASAKATLAKASA